MDFSQILLAGFLDETAKIAAAHGRAHVKVRAGRRPISVHKLLEKEKGGNLYKKADSQGSPQDVRGSGADDPGAASPPRRPGDVSTRGPTTDMSQKTGSAFADEFLKIALVPGANTQTPPFPTAEEPYLNAEAKKPRKKGDVPSKEDENVVDRFDGRGSATTVTGLGQHSTGIGAFNSPAEHY